jgi:hypothetical protein
MVNRLQRYSKNTIIFNQFAYLCVFYRVPSYFQNQNMPALADFRLYYNRVIAHELRLLEKRRKRMVGLLLLALLGVCVTIFVIVRQHIPALNMFFWIPLALFYRFLTKQIAAYKKVFKPRIVNLVLKHINPTLLYDAKGGIAQERFMASNIFVTQPDAYHAEDLVFGRIGDLDFELCELDVRHTPRVEGAPSVLFRGLFFYAKVHEAFEGRIIILPKADTQYLIRSVKAITRHGGSQVMIENDRFNAHYLAYADHATDVSNLLTDHIIEDIVSYKEQYQKKVYMSFHDSYFYVAMHHPKDMLEPNLWTSNLKFQLVKEFYDDLLLITKIARDFDTHN